jgi:hypothetical protein
MNILRNINKASEDLVTLFNNSLYIERVGLLFYNIMDCSRVMDYFMFSMKMDDPNHSKWFSCENLDEDQIYILLLFLLFSR